MMAHSLILNFDIIRCVVIILHVYWTYVSNIMSPEENSLFQVKVCFNPLKCFFGSEGHVALDRNPGTGYHTLLLRMIPGDLLSACPHRQFHTLPSLLDSWAALPNSYPSALRAMQGGSLYHFYDGLWYDPAERRTHNLPCERQTRYRLSQTDTVKIRSLGAVSQKFVRTIFGLRIR